MLVGGLVILHILQRPFVCQYSPCPTASLSLSDNVSGKNDPEGQRGPLLFLIGLKRSFYISPSNTNHDLLNCDWIIGSILPYNVSDSAEFDIFAFFFLCFCFFF